MSANEPVPNLPEQQPLAAPLNDALLSVPAEIPTDHAQPVEISGDRLPLENAHWKWVDGRWVSKRPPHPNFWWSILWCIAFLIVTQVISGFIALFCGLIAFLASGRSLSDLSKSADLQKVLMEGPMLKVAFFLSMVTGIGFSWLALRLVVGSEWPRRVALRRPSLAHLGLALLSVPSIVLLANLAYEVLRRILHVPSFADLMGGKGQSMEDMVKVFGSWPWPLAVLLIGVGPGLSEELWCRGFLGQGLVGRYGVVLGILFSSFFFGLIHIDPAQGSMALLMGLWLHFTYLTTRSLWVPMLLHFFNNSIAVVASHFAPTQEAAQAQGTQALHSINASPFVLPALLYVTASLLLLAIAWALYHARARLTAEDGTEPAPWQPAYPGVEYPPPGSNTRVAHPLPSRVAVGLVVAALIAFVACFVRWMATT